MSHIHWVVRNTGSCRLRESQDNPAFELLSESRAVEVNESFFRDCFDNVAKVVTWISRKGNPFDRHQTIAQDFIAEKKIDCDDDMLKSVETRFESQVSMTERVLQQKKVFKA